MQSPLLSINNLSVTFISEEGSTPTLQNIDIEIAKGELVAIVGESGSGKSVTSLSVLQLLPQPPAKYLNGSILLYSDNNTINILETPKHILQNIRGNKIAMIFQEPMTSLNPVLTCGNQVMEAICLHKTK
jgi:peptide/nickel transport system ATP-binding protein